MTLNKKNISGASVSVIGAARSGLDIALLLKKKGAHVFLSEHSSQKEKQAMIEKLKANDIAYEFGGHTNRIYNADAVITSPGIPVTSPLLQAAVDHNIEVLGELEVASWFCRAPMAAITGSNGKSTTTALLGDIFKREGRPCIVAGNIGTTLSSQVDKTVPNGVAVVEVSNFQLETVRDFHPKVAVYLNLTPDHLDRHGTLEAYGQIKARIFKNQTRVDTLIYNGLDPLVTGLARFAKGQTIPFGLECQSGDCAFVKENMLTIRLDGVTYPLVMEKEMALPGPHNVQNALAAALAAKCMDASTEAIRDSLKSFKGLQHRMEFVRELNGVKYINDSKATNVDSMWYALGSFKTRIVLIAGGRDKNSDFTILKDRIHEKSRAVILIGEAADKMEKAFKGACPVYKAGSLRAAINRARNIAETGDVIMLSPGCASFDMFNDFMDRGDQFKKQVMDLS